MNLCKISVTLIDVNKIRCVWHITVEILIKYFVKTDEKESGFSMWTDRTHRTELMFALRSRFADMPNRPNL